MIALLFAALALAAAPKNPLPLWTLEFKGERPVAVFFDAATSALFVSLRSANGEGGRIAKVSQAGKLENSVFALSKGPPGALRAFDGKIYWISGNRVESKGDEGILTEGTVATELGEPSDIAVDRRGVVYVGTSGGSLVRLSAGVAEPVQKGRPITGLYLYQDTLHLLRGTKVQAISVSASVDAEASSLPFFCEKECRGLERTSAGKWLTVSGRRVVEVGARGRTRTLYASPGANAVLGRPAYVFQMNTAEDFFVVPFPAEARIQAFRVNAAPK